MEACPTFSRNRLFEGIEASPEVDVQGTPANHHCGHRFHSSLLGLGDSIFGFTEIDDFKINFVGIEEVSERRLSIFTDRTSGMIEYSSSFHCIGLVLVLVLVLCANFCRTAMSEALPPGKQKRAQYGNHLPNSAYLTDHLTPT
jgi:hypothetical protein